jgi:preprotein translocase subunit SecD
MARRVFAKLVVIGLVLVLFGTIGIYPIVSARYGLGGPRWLLDHQLKLGLDLKGGVHLVVRVQTEAAWRAEVRDTAESVRAALRTAGLPVDQIEEEGAAGFVVSGVPPARMADVLEATTSAEAAFSRSQREDGAVTFTLRPETRERLKRDALAQALETIGRRVDELGVSEPSISTEGPDGDEIVVQLPGVSDVARAKAIIQAAGVLELRIVVAGPAPSPAGVMRTTAADVDILQGTPQSPEGVAPYYVVQRVPIATGRDLRNARPALDEMGLPGVRFTLSRESGARFARATAANVGRWLAIVLDSRVQSVARIENAIASEGLIRGQFTPQQAQDLAIVLRSGSLSAPLSFLHEERVGASLGAYAIRDGIAASSVGLLLVALFMLVYYRLAGVNAIVALLCNLVIVLGWMAYLGRVLTLPGIAGFALTIGVGVDSNVLIFERIKEELAAGRSARASLDAGFRRVFVTLLDTHIAALVATAFLFQFGTGPIRGFAVTLAIGLVSNLFTATFVSRTLFELGQLVGLPLGLSGTRP